MSSEPAPLPISEAEPEEGSDAVHVAKRHHYVQRFLLAGFTPSGRKSDKLWCFDRERTKPEHRTTKAVAYEEDYYAVAVPGQPKDLIETYFSRVETVAAPIIQDMIANRVMPVGTDYANLMYFLGLMNGRSPAFRDALVGYQEDSWHNRVKILASSRENYEAGLRGYPADKRKPTFETIQKLAAEDKFVEVANPSAMHAQGAMLGLDNENLKLLGSRNWTLLFAPDGGVHFVCSDNPISIRDSGAPFERFVPPGIVYAGTDFVLPIHRSVALLGRFEGTSEVHDVGDEVVAAINRRTMMSARRYVFAPEREFYVMELDGSIVEGSAGWLLPLPVPA
jgi:hypothetical protein